MNSKTRFFHKIKKKLINVCERDTDIWNDSINPFSCHWSLSILPENCVKCVCILSFSGPYFPAFGLNTGRYSVSFRLQSECRKIRTRKTPNTVIFHTVENTRKETSRMKWVKEQLLMVLLRMG